VIAVPTVAASTAADTNATIPTTAPAAVAAAFNQHSPIDSIVAAIAVI